MIAWADERARERFVPDLVLNEWGIDLNKPGLEHAGNESA